MKWLLLLTLAAPALAQIRAGASVAEITWSTPSSFRYRCSFGAELPALSGKKPDEVKVARRELPDEFIFGSAFLVVSVRKDDLRVKVTRVNGAPLMADATAAQLRDGVISWERAAEPGERYYGLGARTGASLNLRGMLVQDATPFFFSSAGYGELHVTPGKYDFDMERLHQGRYRIDLRGSSLIDYYFYFGPTPKEIFEERLKTVGVKFTARDDATSIERMVEHSLSGIVLPVPTVMQVVPATLRPRLDAYLAAYTQEVDDRGAPILHPLPFQFPGDPEADLHRDESMFGDELLIAAGRSVYLPRGIWTNLKSNEEIAGRKTIALPDAPAVFARNGSIVPLAGSGTLELHYFPKLGAEFFLFDEDAADYTQVHAAPAADLMRLEIESKTARDYTWVVHHVDGVKSVASAGEGEHGLAEVKSAAALRDRSWYTDAGGRNVYVRCRVAAGEDLIVNLSF